MVKKDIESELEQAEFKKRKGNQLFTLFLLMTPSLLLAMSAAIESIYLRMMFQILLMFIQIVVVKNFLDRYYDLE